MGRADYRLMLVDISNDVTDLLVRVPRRCRARGTVWLTIDIVPPPTNFLVLTSPRSGSIPVVSQSIIRPIVLWLIKPFAMYVTLSGTERS